MKNIWLKVSQKLLIIKFFFLNSSIKSYGVLKTVHDLINKFKKTLHGMKWVNTISSSTIITNKVIRSFNCLTIGPQLGNRCKAYIVISQSTFKCLTKSIPSISCELGSTLGGVEWPQLIPLSLDCMKSHHLQNSKSTKTSYCKLNWGIIIKSQL